MQSPLSRFGDTAANVGVLSVLDASEKTNGLPVALKTALASCGAAAWRLVIMPIDGGRWPGASNRQASGRRLARKRAEQAKAAPAKEKRRARKNKQKKRKRRKEKKGASGTTRTSITTIHTTLQQQKELGK
eukprot:GHVT01060840.1.p1 GENE.GHVT01060840.1~~GHVT01060840.1.p1  ORF type:complete len:131 (-),score=33.24 GHVT01060840.1:4496-4888(-)